MSEPISLTDEIKHDVTKLYDYARLVEEEIHEYSNIEVTEDLKEGGAHAFKCWEKWFRYIGANELKTGLHSEVVAYANNTQNPAILSMGCGYGGQEIQIARELKKPYSLLAVDINESLFDQGKNVVEAEGLNIEFRKIDLNFADMAAETFDVIYAHASLHHIINLEHVLDAIHRSLKKDGVFIILDMIGKSQVLFWKENVDFTRKVVSDYFYREIVDLRRQQQEMDPPGGLKSGVLRAATALFPSLCFKMFPTYFLDGVIPQYAEPDDQVGMEGARQEEIQPEILKRFVPVKEFTYGSFMRMICTNNVLGRMLDSNPEYYDPKLTELCQLDLKMVREQVLKPTELFGVYKKI